MTTARPQLLAEPSDFVEPIAISETPRTSGGHVIDALGTFCLVTAFRVVVCTANPFAALGIGAVLVAVVYPFLTFRSIGR